MITLFFSTLFMLLAGTISLAVTLSVGLIGLIFYIWQSVEFFWLFQRYNYLYAWMAWVPLLRYFAFAEVAGDPDGTNNIPIFGSRFQTKIFRFWPLLTLVLSRIDHIGGLLEFLVTIVCLGSCFTTIYSRFEGRSIDDVKVIGYLSGWIPLIGWIKIMKYKRR